MRRRGGESPYAFAFPGALPFRDAGSYRQLLEEADDRVAVVKHSHDDGAGDVWSVTFMSVEAANTYREKADAGDFPCGADPGDGVLEN